MISLLDFGENVRETNSTFWFSIPIFLLGVVWYSITGNKRNLANAYGQLGIVPKNAEKHHFKFAFNLSIARFLFIKSSQLAPDDEKPAHLLKLGQIYARMGDYRKAYEALNKAEEIVTKFDNTPLLGYVLSHLGQAQYYDGKFTEAKASLEKSLRLLEDAVKNKPNSFHYNIWLSGAYLDMFEWNFRQGNKEKALEWVKKAEGVVNQHNLQARSLDVKNSYKKLSV